MGTVKRARRSVASALAVCTAALMMPVASQASGAGYFCNQDTSYRWYSPYQDCWGGNARIVSAVYVGTPSVSACASYSTYYGEPFSTSRHYTCGSGYWNGIAFPYNTSNYRYPQNHMQGQAGHALGYYGWN